jgi:DNA-binding SARP family transcriptional activator
MPVFLMLGPLEVRTPDGVPVPLSRHKLRQLLALLLLRPNTAIDVDEMVDALWGERPPASARANVYSYIGDLRRVLADATPPDRPRLIHCANGYRLELRPGECDVDVFEHLAAGGHRALLEGRHRAAAEQLRRALALWRGPLLRGIDNEFCIAIGARLEQTRLAAVEDHAEVRLHLGQHAELASDLAEAVRRDPLRERLWGQFMLALWRAGRRTDALLAYQRLGALLQTELGTGPSAELRALYETIRYSGPDPVTAYLGRCVGRCATLDRVDRISRGLVR